MTVEQLDVISIEKVLSLHVQILVWSTSFQVTECEKGCSNTSGCILSRSVCSPSSCVSENKLVVHVTVCI